MLDIFYIWPEIREMKETFAVFFPITLHRLMCVLHTTYNKWHACMRIHFLNFIGKQSLAALSLTENNLCLNYVKYLP